MEVGDGDGGRRAATHLQHGQHCLRLVVGRRVARGEHLEDRKDRQGMQSREAGHW